MKKLKKLFLVVSILAVLMVMMVVSVSAAQPNDIIDNYRDVSSYNFSVESEAFSFDEEVKNMHVEVITLEDGAAFPYFTPEFYNDYIKDNNYENYDEFISINNISSVYKKFGDIITDYDLDYSVFANTNVMNYMFELQFKTWNTSINELENNNNLLNSQLEEKNSTVSTLQGQVTELNTTITEKDAVITEKDTTISTLQGENANLQIDVDSLNTQVENLVEEKTVINSELKALEAKMEREIDKAYEQGYEDADGFNFMPIIACLSVVVLIVTIISFVVTNKRKKRR